MSLIKRSKIEEQFNQTNTTSINIGDPDNLSTDATDNLVNAVNEIDSDVGDLSTLSTDATDNLVNAVNDLNDIRLPILIDKFKQVSIALDMYDFDAGLTYLT